MKKRNAAALVAGTMLLLQNCVAFAQQQTEQQKPNWLIFLEFMGMFLAILAIIYLSLVIVSKTGKRYYEKHPDKMAKLIEQQAAEQARRDAVNRAMQAPLDEKELEHAKKVVTGQIPPDAPSLSDEKTSDQAQ